MMSVYAVCLFCLPLLSVYIACLCCLTMLSVYAVCLCCLPMLSVCSVCLCCLCMLSAYVVCLYRLSMLSAYAVYLCCLPMLSVYVVCLCYLAMLPAFAGSFSACQLPISYSATGKFPSPRGPIYKATKFALHGFFDSLQLDLAIRGSNITITTIVLGLFGTKNVIEKTKGNIPKSAQYGDPQDAANAVVHSTTLGQHEVYHPWSQMVYLQFFYVFWPQLLDWIMVAAHASVS